LKEMIENRFGSQLFEVMFWALQIIQPFMLMSMYNLCEFAKFSMVISCLYHFFIVCWMCEIYFIMFYIVLFVFYSYKVFRCFCAIFRYIHYYSHKQFIIVACVECFRTTSSTMCTFYKVCYYYSLSKGSEL
jgi:hypothetical protein